MEIIWGRLAHKSIIETLSFLSEEWGEQVAKRLWKNTQKDPALLRDIINNGLNKQDESNTRAHNE